MNVSLRDMVSGIIQYFKGEYRLWRLAYPFGVIFLVFIITALLEYKNGGYKINHPGEFILVTVLMYVLMFIPMRYARNVNVKDLESCLKNLDEKEYSSNENIIRRHRIFLIIFAVGLALIVIGTLVLWYISAGK